MSRFFKIIAPLAEGYQEAVECIDRYIHYTHCDKMPYNFVELKFIAASSDNKQIVNYFNKRNKLGRLSASITETSPADGGIEVAHKEALLFAINSEENPLNLVFIDPITSLSDQFFNALTQNIEWLENTNRSWLTLSPLMPGHIQLIAPFNNNPLAQIPIQGLSRYWDKIGNNISLNCNLLCGFSPRPEALVISQQLIQAVKSSNNPQTKIDSIFSSATKDNYLSIECFAETTIPIQQNDSSYLTQASLDLLQKELSKILPFAQLLEKLESDRISLQLLDSSPFDPLTAAANSHTNSFILSAADQIKKSDSLSTLFIWPTTNQKNWFTLSHSDGSVITSLPCADLLRFCSLLQRNGIIKICSIIAQQINLWSENNLLLVAEFAQYQNLSLKRMLHTLREKPLKITNHMIINIAPLEVSRRELIQTGFGDTIHVVPWFKKELGVRSQGVNDKLSILYFFDSPDSKDKLVFSHLANELGERFDFVALGPRKVNWSSEKITSEIVPYSVETVRDRLVNLTPAFLIVDRTPQATFPFEISLSKISDIALVSFGDSKTIASEVKTETLRFTNYIEFLELLKNCSDSKLRALIAENCQNESYSICKRFLSFLHNLPTAKAKQSVNAIRSRGGLKERFEPLSNERSIETRTA